MKKILLTALSIALSTSVFASARPELETSDDPQTFNSTSLDFKKGDTPESIIASLKFSEAPIDTLNFTDIPLHENIKIIAPFLPSTLRSLSLRDTYLMAQGMNTLAPFFFSKLQNLTYLDLSGCHLGLDGLNKFIPQFFNLKSLQTLDLSANSLGHQGVATFLKAAKQLPALTSLGLAENGLKKARGASVIEQIPSTLELLNLACNPFYDEGILVLTKSFSRFSSLKTLSLANTGMAQKGFEAIKQESRHLTSLSDLYLYGNCVVIEQDAIPSVTIH